MRQILKALAFLAMMLPGVAAAQCYSATPLPVNTVLGRLGATPGPCQAIPFATLSARLTGASITLNSGNGQTAPGAMSGGNTYTFGATTDTPRFAGIGLGGAAPATGLEVYNAAASPTGNGQGMVGATSLNGGVVQGQGSVFDAALANKSGAVALGITTGTTNAVLTGTLTAASLSTSGTVAGSVCMTSAGLMLYEAGVNCFTVSGISVASGKTLTVSNTLTFTGTDGTSFAFPSSSDTVDTLAATQTVSGNKTFSGTLNITGTGQINGTAFGTFATQNFATPPAIGATTPSTGAFSTLTATTPIGLTSGGTNASTAAGARASAGLNIDEITPRGDSNYSILATDRTVATSSALTAPRTWTLPTAASVNGGQHLYVQDFKGFVSNTNTLTLARNGSDTINGGTGSQVINNANGGFLLISDGTSNWSAQALGAQAAAGVASLNGQTGNPSIVAGTGISVATSGGNISVGNTGLVTASTGLTNSSGTLDLDSSKLTFGGRLTLVSAQPEPVGDTVGSQNLWYAPVGAGNSAPIYNGTLVKPYQFTSSNTDLVGMNLALAGSANWAVGTIHDVFYTLNSGTPVLATRAWDSAMQPTLTLIPGVAGNTITSMTGAQPWTRSTAPFNGTPSQNTAASAVFGVTSNNGFANCLGQDWTVGVTNVVSRVVITSPTDNTLTGSSSTYFQNLEIFVFGSNDNVNWQRLAQPSVNANVANGTAFTLDINPLNNIAYRYDLVCIQGDGTHGINVAQIQFYKNVAATTRRLVQFGGFKVNDASATGRINSTTTITIPQYQGTYLGSFQVDAGTAGQVTCQLNFGPSRACNIWNDQNQRIMAMEAGIVTTVTAADTSLNYSLATPTNVAWGPIQGSTTFSLSLLIGYAADAVNVDLLRTVYLNSASGSASYEAAIGLDSTTGFCGTGWSTTSDANGPQIAQQGRAECALLPFFGSHTYYGIERMSPSNATGIVQSSRLLQNTRLKAMWKG